MVVIVYGGKYWTGTSFSKQEGRAMKFKSAEKAWRYVDYVFPPEIAEECSLKGKAS